MNRFIASVSVILAIDCLPFRSKFHAPTRLQTATLPKRNLFGPMAKAALPKLTGFLDDDDEEIAGAAIAAIAKISSEKRK
jgi:hypothetical protein